MEKRLSMVDERIDELELYWEREEIKRYDGMGEVKKED